MPGDCLYVDREKHGKIKPGDIILFRLPYDERTEREYVHRVIKITSKGLTTKGDNNPLPDDIVTVPNSNCLIGKIVAYERKSKKKKVWGGVGGLVHARIIYYRYHLRKIVRVLFRHLYSSLKKTDIAKLIWKPKIGKVLVNTKKGVVVKYICSGITVAVLVPDNKTFLCHKPFDLVMDNPLLKKNNTSY